MYNFTRFSSDFCELARLKKSLAFTLCKIAPGYNFETTGRTDLKLSESKSGHQFTLGTNFQENLRGLGVDLHPSPVELSWNAPGKSPLVQRQDLVELGHILQSGLHGWNKAVVVKLCVQAV